MIGAGILHGSTPPEVSASLGANGLGPNNVTGVGLVSVNPGAGSHFFQSKFSFYSFKVFPTSVFSHHNSVYILFSGFVLEALMTMLLVLVVYATAVDNKVVFF